MTSKDFGRTRGVMQNLRTLNWTRRRLLRWLGVVGGGLLASAGCGPETGSDDDASATSQPPTQLLDRALRQHFSYLSIEPEVIEAFSRDLTRHQGPWNPKTSPPPFTRFLASTDFFQNGADETRPLHYVTYYDPYVSSCYNPFEI